LDFVQASGIRRESIVHITSADFLRDKNGVWVWLYLIERRGRARNAVILKQDRDRITAVVDAAIPVAGLHRPFLKEPNNNATPHYCRSEYTQLLYTDLIQAQQTGHDYYAGMYEQLIDECQFTKSIIRYPNETVQSLTKTLYQQYPRVLNTMGSI